jgi:lambda family phage tail tape measure protein
VTDQVSRIILQAVDKTKEGINSAKSGMESMKGTANSLNGVLAKMGPLAGILGAVSFTALIKGGIDSQDMLADLSDRTGIAATTLAGFQLVAKQSDTSLEALGKGVNKLSIFMAENAEEARKLGLTAQEPDEAFIQLAKTISGIENVQQRNAVANKVLGKSYQDLLPALLQGEQKLRDQIQAGREYSGVTEEGVRQSQRFNDELDLLKIRGAGLGVSLANELLPSLNQVIAKMKETAKESGLLKTALLGLGELGKITLFGSDAENKRQRATSGIPNQITAIATQLRNDATGAKPLSFSERKRLELEIQYLAKEKNNLERELGIGGAGPDKPKTKEEDTLGRVFGSGGGKTKADTANETAESYAKTYGELAKIVEGTDKLTKAEQTLKDIEQGRFDSLLPWQREQLANLAQQAKLKQDLNTFDEINKKIVEDLATKRAEELDALEKTNQSIVADIEAKRAAGRENHAQTINDLEEQNRELDFQLSIQDMSERAQRQAIANRQVEIEMQRIINQAAADGVVLQAQEVEAIREKLQAIGDKSALLDYKRDSLSMYDDLINAVRGYGREFTTTLREAFKTGELDFKDMASRIIDTLIDIQIQTKITDPLINAGTKAIDSIFNGASGGGLFDAIGSLFGGGSANGNVFNAGSMMKFANGGAFTNGMVNTPTMFPMGLMGEAGPEAIMPLQRDGSGRLGVKASGGGAPTVIVNQTINIDSRSDQASIMAAMRTAKEQAVAAVADSFNRNGALARAARG